MLSSIKAFFLDLSGVLYEGDQIIPEAVEVVDSAREQDLVLRFSQYGPKGSAYIRDKLAKMGFPIQAEELFPAPIAARQYIKSKKLRPYCLIHEAIKEEFSDLDQNDPNSVLLGDAQEDLNYDSSRGCPS